MTPTFHLVFLACTGGLVHERVAPELLVALATVRSRPSQPTCGRSGQTGDSRAASATVLRPGDFIGAAF